MSDSETAEQTLTEESYINTDFNSNSDVTLNLNINFNLNPQKFYPNVKNRNRLKNNVF